MCLCCLTLDLWLIENDDGTNSSEVCYPDQKSQFIRNSSDADLNEYVVKIL